MINIIWNIIYYQINKSYEQKIIYNEINCLDKHQIIIIK